MGNSGISTILGVHFAKIRENQAPYNALCAAAKGVSAAPVFRTNNNPICPEKWAQNGIMRTINFVCLPK
jgi:hypothetical protein